MQKTDTLYTAYVEVLKEELLPAMGCTEPIAIAYAAAAARRIFPAEPGWPRLRRPGPRSTAPPVQDQCAPAFPAAAAYSAQCSSARPPLQE